MVGSCVTMMTVVPFCLAVFLKNVFSDGLSKGQFDIPDTEVGL